MLSERAEFHLPTRPYSPIDALNRRAAAMGSPGYAMATHYADYNGHHVTLSWNDYRRYYVAEYFWAGRVVLARGEFADCLAAVLYEQNLGKLGSSAGIYPRKDDAEAIALCERTAGVVAGDIWVKGENGSKLSEGAWYTWRHECAAAAARDYANPGAPVMRFDWELMQAAEDQNAYEAALVAKYGSVYEGGPRREIDWGTPPPAAPAAATAPTAPAAPKPAKAPARFCYRCADCLFVSFTEEVLKGDAECAGCGGKVEAMGRVRQKRLTSTEVRCACDGRCTGATGPACDCSCGGVNHGTGAVVRIVKDEGAVPRLSPRNADAQYAAAVEYRRAVEAAKGRMEAEFGSLLADYRAGRRIISYETYSEIRKADREIVRAKGLRSRAGRIKALAKVCPERNDDTCQLAPA